MRAIDCGIDIGSTNLKVILVTDDGEIIGVRTVPSPRINDSIGPVTDALALVDLLEVIILECWRDTAQGRPLRSITAVGVGEDGVGVDVNMEPTGFSLPWFDMRARDEASELAENFDFDARTGLSIGPDRTAAKWLWLYRNRPQELARAKNWITLTDFPAAYWTGRAFMSASLAPRTACYDVFLRQWIPELLGATHAPLLPEILGAGTSLGPIRRGRLVGSGAVTSETVVAVGGHDHPIAASVIRAYDQSAIVDSLGTANLLYGETDMFRARNFSSDLAISVPPDGHKGLAILGVLEFSAAVEASGASKEEIQSFLSHTTLPGCPVGNIRELGLRDTDPHVNLRRSIEQACFKAQFMAESMSSLGVPNGPIYSTGGWSRSRGFMMLRASVFGQTLRVLADIELSALGAAQFGAKAATGRLTSPVSTFDIRFIDPVKDWVPVYKMLAREMKSSKTA